jgi:hypothetical protein
MTSVGVGSFSLSNVRRQTGALLVWGDSMTLTLCSSSSAAPACCCWKSTVRMRVLCAPVQLHENGIHNTLAPGCNISVRNLSVSLYVFLQSYMPTVRPNNHFNVII